MAEENYQELEFVGIVEHVMDVPYYNYCGFNISSGGMSGHASVECLGETIAYQFGKNFRKRITYEPPRGIENRGIERGVCPKIFHRLSVLEQDRFERTVLNVLNGKKSSKRSR